MKRHALTAATALALLAMAPLARAGITQPDAALAASGASVDIDVLANDGAGASLVRVVLGPRHGTATIVDGKVRYTAAPGYVGVDGFEYMARSRRGMSLGRVRVDVGQGLVLQGRVTDAPVANATVVATVGGHSFATTADAQGNYTLPVVALQDGMVELSAQGTGPQAGVALLSTAGSFEGLRAAAGADGVLDRSESNTVQVTQLSTAQALMMQVANGGAALQTDAELARARDTMDFEAMLEMAGAIKLVADGRFPLPEGVADTLALVGDSSAYRRFLDQVNAADGSALATARAETLADQQIVTPQTAAGLVGSYLLMYELGRQGTVRVGLIQGEELSLASNGTGEYIHSTPNPSPEVTWSFANGAGHIVRNNPVATLNYVVRPEVGPYQIRRYDTVTSMDIVVLSEGDGRKVVGLTKHFNYSYPDGQLPAGSAVTTVAEVAIDHGFIPFTAEEIQGWRALPTAGDRAQYAFPRVQGGGATMFEFIEGGAGYRRDNNDDVLWELGPEGLWLEVKDRNGTYLTRYFRLQRDGRKGDGVLMQSSSAEGFSTSWGLSVAVDGSGVMDEPALAQSWHSGFFISPASRGELDYYLLLGGPALTGEGRSYAGNSYSVQPLSWRTDLSWIPATTSMWATQYRDNSGNVAFCTFGVNGCVEWRSRQWMVLARDGDRVYVLEELAGDYDGNGHLDGDSEIDNQRVNFYDLQAPPAP